VKPGASGFGFALLDHAEASGSRREEFHEAVRSNIRYADPSSWCFAGAVGQVVKRLKVDLAAAQNHVGVIAIAEGAPRDATQAVAATMEKGYVSPMQFAAANAGSVLAVACIAHGFRGPTLNLTVPLETGLPVGLLLADRWIGSGTAKYVFVGTWEHDGARGPVARVALLGAPAAGAAPRSSSTAEVLDVLGRATVEASQRTV